MRVPALIRSGWWVAAAAVVVSLVTAWIFVAPLMQRTTGRAPDSGFVIRRATVPHDLIVRAMAQDGVRVLSDPETMTADESDRRNEEERGKLLVPDDRVIGVVIGGEAIAYPLRLMRWHEVVNDVVGGEPIAVTYSPLCDSVVVFSRIVDEEIVKLGVSGYLYNSNTLLYDRRSQPAASPMWSQLDGRIVAEPDPGSSSPLAPRVAVLATWGEWRDRYPDTRVLAPLEDLKKLYKRDPYHSYFGSDLLHFPVRPLPPLEGRRLKDRLVMVTVDGQDGVFALRDLAAIALEETYVRAPFAGQITERLRHRFHALPHRQQLAHLRVGQYQHIHLRQASGNLHQADRLTPLEAVGHGLGSHLDQADHRHQGPQVPQPAYRKIGPPAPRPNHRAGDACQQQERAGRPHPRVAGEGISHRAPLAFRGPINLNVDHEAAAPSPGSLPSFDTAAEGLERARPGPERRQSAEVGGRQAGRLREPAEAEQATLALPPGIVRGRLAIPGHRGIHYHSRAEHEVMQAAAAASETAETRLQRCQQPTPAD